jgi:iron complex transport system substrate-binding protein
LAILLFMALLPCQQALTGETSSIVQGLPAPPKLQQPARRIVSLAPHLTELVYAAGAGDRLMAAVEHSDYPPPARALPRIGSAHGLDMEAIVMLQPDLVLAWRSGNPVTSVGRLQALGLPVYVSEIAHLSDIPDLVEILGALAGTGTQARRVAAGLRERHARLKTRYARKSTHRVFYQVLDESLLTLNGQHLVSEIIELCGGKNVFTDLPSLVARVDAESVLAADPQVMIMSGEKSLMPVWQKRWQAWSKISAVRDARLYFIEPDLLHRAGPRAFEGAEQLCALLARRGR